MRFRAKIVHVVVAGLPATGCTQTEVDTKPTQKSDTATKSTPPEKEVKADPKPEPKPDLKPIVVETPDDIPVQLAGVAMPYTPPEPTPPPKGDGKAALAPAPAPAPAAAQAPAAAAAASPAPTASGPTAVAVAHNHAPGEPCQPLTRAEVEKALTDLRK